MGRRLRVAHIVHSLEVGGLENGVVNVINGLREDFDHAVVCIGPRGRFAARLAADVPIWSLDKQPGERMPLAALRLAGRLRAWRPDVVHSRNWAAIDGVLAAWLARVPRVIHGEHGREAADPYGLDRRRRRRRRLLAPLVERFVTVSQDLRRWLIDSVGIRAEKIVVVQNGVDAGRFSGGGREKARHALDASNGDVVVGTVGRLDAVKDQATLLRALARLALDRPRALLVLVGGGPERARLESLAASLGVAARLRLLGERDDVAELLVGFDVFVLSSIAEGASNTVLEAMAAGLPVVATDVGGNPELVDDGITGQLVPPAEPALMAAGIARYIVDPERRAAHGAAGRRKAREQFDVARMLAGYRAIYARAGGG